MNCPKCGWPQVGVENRQDWVDCVKALGKQLRAAKREKRQADKLLKGQALTDSRIIGELKRETRKAEAKLKVADAMLSEIWGAYNRIGDALKMPEKQAVERGEV